MEVLLAIAITWYVTDTINNQDEKNNFTKSYSSQKNNKRDPFKETFTENKENNCETEITEMFFSKESGWITVCKGKILTNGQKTRIVTVKK